MKNSEMRATQSDAIFEIAEDGPVKYKALMRKNQNLKRGILMGIAGAIVGLILWGGAMFLFRPPLMWGAIAASALAGLAVRVFGKGVEPKFGVIGAVISLFVVATGNMLTGYFTVALALEDAPWWWTFKLIGPLKALSFLVTSFQNVLFCLVAVAAGFFIAYKPLKDQ